MVVVKFALLSCLYLSFGPWPQFHHDPEHTGRTGAIGPKTNRLSWKFHAGGYLSSSPVVGAGDTVYIGNSDGTLFAVSPTGEKQWEFRTRGFIKSTPAVSEARGIYFGSNDNHFYALTPAGDTMWCYDTGQQVASSPNIYPNAVFVGSGATFYAFSLSGKKVWEYPSGPVKSSPAVSHREETVYFQSYWQEPHGLYALNTKGGSLRWFEETGGGTSSPALGQGGTVYVGSDNGALYAFSPDGEPLWCFVTGNKIESSPAIGFDGTIYVGSNDSCLYAINPDGSEKWHFKTGGPVKSSPAIDRHNTVYFGSLDCNIYAVDSAGTQVWFFQTTGPIDASPAIGSDGTIYIGSWDGYLYAIGPGEGINEDTGSSKQLPVRLFPPTPNPFTQRTKIGFSLSSQKRAVLEILDAAGRKVQSFTVPVRGQGYYEVMWDGSDSEGKRVASGIYFSSLRTQCCRQIQKIVFINQRSQL